MGQPVETESATHFGSIGEYLRFDDETEGKHEYCNGEIVARDGATVNHARIATNVGIELSNRLRGTPCEPFGSDLRVGVPKVASFSYPDLTVVCGPLQFDPRDRKQNTVINPRLIVEVLSPGTERHDRGRKFKNYLRLESLEEYVLVSQDEPRVESYFRNSEGAWLFSYVEGVNPTAFFKSLKIEIPLIEVYRNVVFPPPEEMNSADAAGAGS